ncbi:unnamed protein product [Moneuplotes crassus]|uniref:Uncharacterized protein n=2 Tax=Euplotes crassus TaxID=5936 RepID=A0AAD1XXY6_EUPCR|nr:unnamed protein product [Moneuplotes crassus]
MSKAYYYVKNFTFKEANNLFAYQVKDPSVLTRYQRITRLYKGTLRKLLANYVFTLRGRDYEVFFEETRKVREDFDKLMSSNDPLLFDATISKYEKVIEDLWIPDASLNHSRPYSNLGGKMPTYPSELLEWDPYGYYTKDRLVSGEPTGVGFYEELPDQANAWTYESLELNDDFDANINELEYKSDQPRSELKKHLDELHK